MPELRDNTSDQIQQTTSIDASSVIHTRYDRDEELLAALNTTNNYGFCPNRISGLDRGLPGGFDDLRILFPQNDPRLVIMLSQQPDGFANEHRSCSFDFCEQSQKNYTSVVQRHEPTFCPDNTKCHQLEGLFPRDVLSKALQKDQPTAWQLNGALTVEKGMKYMAISHVWSDGTGSGTWDELKVNRCLFHLFRRIAFDLGCVGLWWDTLCVPSKLPLVHDCYLRSTEWIDAEMACVAILTSPWFSRGWTALELAKSRGRIHVMFKGPDGPLLKDLDREILLTGSSSRTCRHEIASTIIQKLRQGQVTTVNDLLITLGSRHTSWSRDMSIISALLVGIKVNGYESQQEIYRMIFQVVRGLNHAHLFHKSLANSRRIGWEPASFFDLPLTKPSSLGLPVLKSGNLNGCWEKLPCNHIHQSRIVWNQAHPFVESRIRSHLKRAACELLVEPNIAGVARALVVTAQGGIHHVIGSLAFQPSLSGIAGCALSEVTIQGCSLRSQSVPSVSDGSLLSTVAVCASSDQDWTSQTVSRRRPLRRIVKMLEPLFAHHYISTLSPQETDDLFSKLDTENGESGVIDFLQTNETFDGKIPRIDRLVRWTAARGYDRFLKYTIEAVIDNLDGIPAACIRVVSLPAERFSQIFALVFDKVAVEDGRTPLLVALRKGHSQVAQVLLSWYEVHASIERVDKTGFTSLILAAMLGQCEVCSLLIRSRRCDIEATDHFHRTALHHAARQGHVDVVKLLLHTAGSDSSVQDCFIRTPLHYAAKRGHYHVANLLLEHYEDARNSSDKEYLTPLAWAAREGHVRVARLIIEKGKVEATVRYGQRQGLMMWAAANGCFELVAIFVELNEDVARSEDGEGRNPLFHASAGGHTAIVELLLSIGKVSAQAKDRNDGTALHYAAQNEHQDVAKLLLGAGADIDSKNSKGQTPLIAAITTPGNEDMVATLMRFGKADINLADEDRSTPLHLASGRFANQYVVRMLLDREDCYVHETDRKGNLAIHSAFHYCNIAILDMLLRDERCPSPALFDIEEVETRKLIYFLRKFEVEHTKHEVGQGELASLNANIRPEGLLARLIGITSHVEDVPDEHINSLVNRLPEALFAVSFRVAEIVADRAGYEINVVNKQGESALFIASASGLVDLVRLLCRYDQTEIGKSHEHGQTSLSIAAYYGHAEVVDVLIGTGKVDLGFFEYGSWTPLMYAAQRGHLDTMMVILRSGSTDTHARNLEGKTALLLASEGGHLACVKALLEDDHVTIDDVATRESLGDLVQMYTAAGAGAGQLRKPEGNLIDRRPYSSWTAHQSALVKGHLSAAGFSPIRHANIEVADHSGITPLMMATRRGDKALVQSLLEHGADADARDSKDLTALLMAIDGWNTLGLREKLVGVVKALLEHSKIDVNARTTSGETALMMAVTRRSYEIVRLLLSSGLVDTGMVDNEGLDALAKTDNTWLGYDERVALAKIGNWDLGYHMLQSGDAFDPDGVDLSEDVLPSGKWDLELDSYFGKFT